MPRTRERVNVDELDDLVPQEERTSFINDEPDPEAPVEFDFAGSADVREGWYAGKVQEMSFGKASTGTLGFTVKVHFPEIDRSLDKFMATTANAAGITGQNLRTLGYTPDRDVPDADGTMKGSVDCSKARGKYVRCFVSMQTMKDGSRRPGIGRMEPPNDETLEFFEKFVGEE